MSSGGMAPGWFAAVRAVGSRWREWVATSRVAMRISRMLALLDSVGAVISAAIIVADLARRRPIGGLTGLLIVAVPVLVIGQLWMICLQFSRQPRPRGPWPSPVHRRGPWLRGARALFVGNLRPRVIVPILVVVALGWVSAMTAVFRYVMDGPPAGAGPACLYRLGTRGNYTCVSRSAYELAGAGAQRFACGILLTLFGLYCSAALAHLSVRHAERAA